MVRCSRDLTTSGRLRQHRPRACLSQHELVVAVEASVANLSPEDRARILNQSMAHFRNPSGPDLLKRTERFNEFVQSRAQFGLWPYSRALEKPTGPHTTVSDMTAATREGINFASQDYLGLSGHPSVAEAGIEAMRRFGPHSAGSAVLLGNTRLSLELEQHLPVPPDAAPAPATIACCRAGRPSRRCAGRTRAWPRCRPRQRRMPAEAQIVLRCEVDAFARGRGHVGNGGVRTRRLLQGPRVGPQAEFGTALHEVVEALGALEEVGPRRVAEVRHRLGHDARPILGAQIGD